MRHSNVKVIIVFAIATILALWLICPFCFAAWDNDKPGDNQSWNTAAGSIRDNWDVLEDALGIDANKIPVNVKAPTYGATGNGTTDDSTAIANAVATGRPVYFPAGTYLTDGFSASSAGQAFFGDSWLDSILLSNSADVMLTITSKDRCIVRDLYFKGGADEDNKVGTKGIEINTSAKCQIHRCRFDYFSSHGIDFATANSGDGVHVISACTFLHPVVGIHFARRAGDSHVINNDIGHSTTAGIDCDAGTVRFISNSIYNNAIGLDVAVGAGVELHRVVVLANNFGDNNIGLNMDGSGGTLLDLCDISHNQFWNNTASNYKGMVLDTVKKSSFSNNNFVLYSDAAMDIDNSNTLIMSNFYFRTCSSHNVELDNSDNCILNNFMFDNPGAVAGNLYLLYKENAPAVCQFTNWQVKTTNSNWYKVTNTGGTQNVYRDIQYQKENGWDTGWYDDTDTVAGVIDIDNTSVKYGFNANNLSTVVIDITNSQIKALAATPKELVAAQGAGSLIEFVSLILLLDYGSEVLAEPSAPDDLAIEYDDGTGPRIITWDTTGFITNNADAMEIINSASVGGGASARTTASSVNKNLVLINTGGEYTGNASNDTAIRVICTYRVHRSLSL